LPIEKPILVTGGPRTGTTWVGRVIAEANSVRYIHEPLNTGNQRCACGLKVDRWFKFISPQDAPIFKTHFAHQLGQPYHLFNLQNLANDLSTQGKTKSTLRTLKNFSDSFFKSRALLKAPLAIFSAGWLSSTFKMDVLILIRHPAAFVSSYKSLNWSHSWSDFLDQPLLMSEHLSPFEKEIQDYYTNEHDLVDQAALLWKLIHYMILKYRRSHPEWIYVRHEDLSLDPMLGFQKIFDHLDLKFSSKVMKMIGQTIDPQNPIDTEDPYSIKRNSYENIGKWRNRLSPQEIKRVRTIVADVAGKFYTESDWGETIAEAKMGFTI